MNCRDTTNRTSDIALTGGSIVAKLFGVINPCAATVGVIVDSIKDRRSRKFSKRLKSLIQSLEKRVQSLESESQTETDLDLLDEIVAKAISDEDEDKTEYYAALIEYYASHTIEAYQVRLLGNALKELTVYEIKSFVNFVNGKNVARDIPEDLVSVFWGRVHFLGLYKGSSSTVKNPTQTTQIGKKFVEIYNLAAAK